MKSRLDVLLVARGLAPTREKAQAMILSGRVEVEGRRVDKAGTAVDASAAVVVLAKPQFEAGRREVPRGGVVRSAATQRRVVAEIEQFGSSLGLSVIGTIPSPIKGARGNQEFLVAFRKPGS